MKTRLFSILLVILAVFTVVSLTKVQNVSAEENDGLIYFEDFEGETVSGYGGNITTQNGRGYFNASGESSWSSVPVDSAKLAACSDVDIEFDMAYNDSNDTYFHLVHLDGTGTDKNIYFDIIANGQYLRLADYDGNDIYDNSGLDQGCNYQVCKEKLNDLDQGVHFRFLIVDDVIEVQIDGRRTITVSLSAFGNNRYMQRAELVKGVLDGLAFDFRCAAGNCWIDNFSVKEYEKDASKTYYVRTDRISGGGEYLPLGIENLYMPNFKATVTFEVMRAEVEDNNDGAVPYAKMQLLLNQLYSKQMSNPENYFNVQTMLDREFSTAWMGGLKEDANWSGASLEYTCGNYAGPTQHTLTVEVYGDTIKFTAVSNGNEPNTRTLTTTFTELGLKKGPLLGINLANHYTDVVYFEYIGFENESDCRVTSEKTQVTTGDEITLTATKFGNATGDFYWYQDGVKTEETGLTYKTTILEAGKHTFAYKSETVASNEVEVNVVGRIIEVSSDKTEIYCNEKVNFTATKQGEFTEDLVWYVDGVATESTGDNFELQGLAADSTHTIKAVAHGVSSNEVTINVLKSTITISSLKGSFDKEETANISASLKGISEEVVSWYVDGAKVEATGTTLELALNGYQGGSTHTIKASCAGFESNELVLTVTYDLKKAVVADENYKVIYEQKITKDSAQTFGGYQLVVPDEGDAYYRCTNATGGNDAQFDSFTVTSSRWALDYDILVPNNVIGEYYVYPQFAGVDTKNPTDMVEMAIAINATGLRTYIKFHNRGINLEETEYGTGADLSYGAGIVNQGTWNHISVVFDGTFIAFYVNDHITFFADVHNTTVPSGATMSTWMANATVSAEVTGYKNFTISAVVEPLPAVSQVSVSASKISGTVGDTITISAAVTPFNALAKEISWYVNDKLVEGETNLTYTLTASEAGEYKVVCKIDGISSSAKTITIKAQQSTDSEQSEEKTGCGSSVSLGIIALINATMICAYCLKKKED